jgi:hypothetical protein
MQVQISPTEKQTNFELANHRLSLQKKGVQQSNPVSRLDSNLNVSGLVSTMSSIKAKRPTLAVMPINASNIA